MLLSAGGFFLFAYYRPLTLIGLYVHWQLWLGGAASRNIVIRMLGTPVRLHYYVGGRGKPVLLLHGLSSSSEAWSGVIGPLMKAGLRVYALDLPGSRNSEAPDVDYSIRWQTEAVHTFLSKLNLTRVDVAGVSMGGWIAMQLAIQYPQPVGHLALIDSAGTNFTPDFLPALFSPSDPEELQKLMYRLSPGPKPVPLFIRRDLMRQLSVRAWVVRRQVQSMFAGHDLVDSRLSEIHAPTLIIWGSQDRLIPQQTGRLLHNNIAGSQLEVVPNCGHTVVELCSQQVAPKLVRFFGTNNLQN